MPGRRVAADNSLRTLAVNRRILIVLGDEVQKRNTTVTNC